MATNVQRGGLGFEKFFRRKAASVKDGELFAKNEKEERPSKFRESFGQKQLEDKNDSAENAGSDVLEIDETNSWKTNGLKNYSEKEQSKSSPEPATDKADDEREPSEACNVCSVKDYAERIKLTEFINNSIKEAVVNIVKEGCPLADSPELCAKTTVKELPSSAIQETQDKENQPACPKHLSSPISEVNQTFDPELCQCHYQGSSQSSSRTSLKLKDQYGRVSVNHCICEEFPVVNETRKSAKGSKQNDKSVREGSPKIPRQPKTRSSHFKTDNRRVTGNINIYICSEANENTGDKQNPGNKDCADDSVSATSSSSLSVSTSKLVAALKKKRQKKLDDQSLSCVCEMPQNSVKQYDSNDKIGNDNNVSCLSDEDSADAGFPDKQSSSSKDACTCGDAKSNDADLSWSDVASLERQPCSSSTSEGYSSYDRDDFSPRVTRDRANYVDSDASRSFDELKHGGNVEKPAKKRCLCCNLRKCKEERPSVLASSPRVSKSQSQRRRTRDKVSRASRDTQQFSKCLCIVEEVDEDCGNERKKSEAKFLVRGMTSTDEDHGKVRNDTSDPEEDVLNSSSGIRENGEADSPNGEKRKSSRTSEIDSPSSPKPFDQQTEPNVEAVVIDSEPQSPKPTLLSSWNKHFGRSSGNENRQSKAISSEITKDQTKTTATEKNGKNDEAPQDTNVNVSPVLKDKRKDSFLFRSIRKAINIVKTSKDEGVSAAVVVKDEKNAEDSSEVPAEAKIIDDKKTNDGENGKINCEGSCNKMDKEKVTLNSSNSLKQENSSRSKISTAIASRRGLAAASDISSNVNTSSFQAKGPNSPTNSSAIHDGMKTPAYGQKMLGCQCGKLSESSECRCKKPESTTEQTCKCHNECQKSKSGTSVCCNNPVNSKKEYSSRCQKCENFVDKCVCRWKKIKPTKSDPCEHCPECDKPISKCECRSSRVEKIKQEGCKFCRRSKRSCRCDTAETSRMDRSQTNKSVFGDFQAKERQCSGGCSLKADCRCNQTSSNWKRPKSMICIYCDKPQNDCVCSAPIRKCSQCGLPLDVCNCKSLPCCDCSGREIVPTNDGDKSTIRVTAWKPRQSVKRYFSRDPNDANGNSDEDCACYDKPYGSDGLPYQKGNVFSDVMSELQQKICRSVGCNGCRKVPCNCRSAEAENQVGRRPKQRSSPNADKQSISRSQDRSSSKSPVESCICGTTRPKSGRKVSPSKICDLCNTSPCRCRRSTASPRKKPPAKCYYCKSSPCTCTPTAEPTKPRPFRKRDSSHRRKKEFDSTGEHVNADVENEDNGHRGRKSNHVVPCPGSQQPGKYCHRGNTAGQHASKPGERVR